MPIFKYLAAGLCLAVTLTPAAAAVVSIGEGVQAEVGFSPDGDSQPIILKAINAARQEILVAAYSFTSKPVSTALLAAHKRGVKVFLVADEKGNAGRYTATTFLANQGVPVRLNGRYKILHHKFMVIDRRHLQTGSFNYSKSAYEANAENVLLLREVPELAMAYAGEWRRLWDEGTPLAPAY